MKRRLQVPSSLFLLIFTAVALFSSERPADETANFKETFDYNFTIKTLSGERIDFHDKFKGKILFINMWATWCKPCRSEMPQIQELYNELGDEVTFVMISIDKDRDHDRVVSYVQNQNYSFPVYMPSGQLPEQLQIPYIPTTFIVDRQGQIIKRNVGAMNYNTPRVKNQLRNLIGSTP